MSGVSLALVCLEGGVFVIDEYSERHGWMVNCEMAHVEDDFGVGVVAAGMYASVLGEDVENGIAAAAVAERTMGAGRVVIPSQS